MAATNEGSQRYLHGYEEWTKTWMQQRTAAFIRRGHGVLRGWALLRGSFST